MKFLYSNHRLSTVCLGAYTGGAERVAVLTLKGELLDDTGTATFPAGELPLLNGELAVDSAEHIGKALRDLVHAVCSVDCKVGVIKFVRILPSTAGNGRWRSFKVEFCLFCRVRLCNLEPAFIAALFF